MERLAGATELLDGPLPDRAALAGNLRDLARANRLLGGADLSARAIEVVAPGTAPLGVLDVGTGGADIPLELIARGRRAGRLIRVTAVDSRPEVLEAAALVDPRLTATGELRLLVADARALPFPDDAFEIAHTSLVVHHLEPDAARSVLAEMARVARLGVVVNDLVRRRSAVIGAWLLSRLTTRNRFTRHDAPMSVRRAYTVDELTALLATAGLRVERRFDGLAGHRVALAARRNEPR